MIATSPSLSPAQATAQINTGRRAHRVTCVLAGGLALFGGALALVIDPWFAVVAAVGGGWLILAPETKSCGK